MPGLGNAIGWLFDLFGSKAERRRNRINQLKREKDDIKKKPYSEPLAKRLTTIDDELNKLYEEAKNA